MAITLTWNQTMRIWTWYHRALFTNAVCAALPPTPVTVNSVSYSSDCCSSLDSVHCVRLWWDCYTYKGTVYARIVQGNSVCVHGEQVGAVWWSAPNSEWFQLVLDNVYYVSDKCIVMNWWISIVIHNGYAFKTVLLTQELYSLPG